jgi:2-oxoisovalerate ferredoxin oxidoreductase alpha subunit
MISRLTTGNDAVIVGALAAGCEHFFGYPITPASQIAEAAARDFPRLGRTFIQAESEIAAVNMVYGASAAGKRAMTASSGPGISLKQETISYLAGAELPAVIVDIMRAGPGLGNIGREQADYNQVVKGGGHGNYRNIVLAPNSVQEMCDLSMLAFELADRYRNPAFVLADGDLGQMMEPLTLPEPVAAIPERPWAVKGDAATRRNLITSIYLDFDDMEAHNLKLLRKYQDIAQHEVRFECHQTDDADIVLVAYGIVSRVARSAVDQARDRGIRAGLLRPKTLFPFPSDPITELAERARHFLVVEMSTGQLIDDVRLALNGKRPVDLCFRVGGNVPSPEEVAAHIERIHKETSQRG